MLEYIDIDVESVPYDFEIKLDSTTYTFAIKYNNVSDFFTIDLYKQNIPLVYGEKIVYGKPLFNPKTKVVNGKIIIIPKTPDYPKIIILPLDFSGKETTVSYNNLRSTVFLYTRTEADLNV